ncbi:cyclase family protein [Beijerinckia indica]|uniref:cyclase family protein n=1 Tax=Beijerinckia indica TaxID=533 RepID=UPI001FCAFB3D|nr:cyclase family protein [Beijerinckia indica]
MSSAVASAEPSLTEIQAVLAHKTFVDLTHAFSETTPVWEGFPQAKMYPAMKPGTGEPYTIKQDGFRSTFFAMVGQYGTHVDPPAHFAEKGATLDQIPLKEMILPLVVFDITPWLDKEPAHVFSLEDLKTWEHEHGRVPEGAFAALRTDMGKDFETNPQSFKRQPFPGWSREAVQFLVEQRGIKAIGHESLDSDVTETMETETYILQSGHYQIEVMTNLDKVPATGALIVVTWPKVEKGLGFPARAFAILP